MMRMILGIWVTLGLIPAASASADLSGKWEAQTMGTDRSVTVEHSGQQLAVHRVLWPEFEGKRYKLEHLFRGTIKGQRISGQLLVREDSAPQYEELRAFDGKVSSAASITIDGIPLKRVGQAPVATPAPPATKATTPPPAPPPTVTPPPPPPKNKPEEKRPKHPNRPWSPPRPPRRRLRRRSRGC